MNKPEIVSKEDLVAFIRTLGEDLRSNPAGWENATLDQFLSALASWIEDSEGYYRSQGRPPPKELAWSDIADMLIAAKMYE